jgi:hypothetical protein
MLPDFVHEKDYDQMAASPDAFLRGPLPRWDRAKEFLRRFVFKISPGSWLNSAQVEQKMIYLQLTRAGWMDIFHPLGNPGHPEYRRAPRRRPHGPRAYPLYSSRWGSVGTSTLRGEKPQAKPLPG